jgi:hypothetical protein
MPPQKHRHSLLLAPIMRIVIKPQKKLRVKYLPMAAKLLPLTFHIVMAAVPIPVKRFGAKNVHI